jgi:hypothetical protein
MPPSMTSVVDDFDRADHRGQVAHNRRSTCDLLIIYYVLRLPLGTSPSFTTDYTLSIVSIAQTEECLPPSSKELPAASSRSPPERKLRDSELRHVPPSFSSIVGSRRQMSILFLSIRSGTTSGQTTTGKDSVERDRPYFQVQAVILCLILIVIGLFGNTITPPRQAHPSSRPAGRTDCSTSG